MFTLGEAMGFFFSGIAAGFIYLAAWDLYWFLRGE